jgi:hypothetical protein
MNATNSGLAATFRFGQLSAENVTMLVGGVVALLTAFITWWFPYLAGRKKSDLDAQASLVSGFVALLAELRSEREQLTRRIGNLEANNQRQDHHIAKLERLMAQHDIDIPEENQDAEGKDRR